MDVKPKILGLDHFLICEERLVPLVCGDISVYGQLVHVPARKSVIQGWTARTLETLLLCLSEICCDRYFIFNKGAHFLCEHTGLREQNFLIPPMMTGSHGRERYFWLIFEIILFVW